MRRTFFAVKTSEKINDLFKKIKIDFPEFVQKVKIANLENPHITIKFLGDTKDYDIDRIDKLIRNKVSEFQKFTYSCQKTGCFPKPSIPKVLWLGVNKGLKNLESLHNLIEHNLKGFGYETSKKKFFPHLTYGRVKRNYKTLESIDSFLKYHYETIEINVEELIWFESILTPKGAIHKPLRKYKLK